MANYIIRQGVKVAPGTYLAYTKLREAFKKATGYDLLITSGYRTYAEQKSLYDRWKAGTFHAPSVARPGTSRHENGRALDLRDSGSSPGVTVAGNKRSNWMRANAARYGFNPNGYSFNEPWHFEYTGNPWSTPSASAPATTNYTKSYIKTIQNYLVNLGYNIGPSGVDGSLGPATTKAVRAFQTNAKLVVDGLPGPKTLSALQSRSSTLAVDGRFGPASTRALQSVLGTPVDGVISGQNAALKRNLSAFSTVQYGSGGSTAVQALQKKLGVVVDGSLGPNTIAAWQKKLGVKADGFFGPDTARAVQRVLNQKRLW